MNTENDRYLMQVPRYGRWNKYFEIKSGVDRVRIIQPDGSEIIRETFIYQPTKLDYDFHGFESISPYGEAITAVRYTPIIEGRHIYHAHSKEEVRETGAFECVTSDHLGYVEVSKKDPRYFAFSNGDFYCPIGLNLANPVYYRMPMGTDHFITGDRTATLGMSDYRRWFSELARNGGNFARIWIGNFFFDAQGETAGELEPKMFARLDKLVELANEYGIRLKLCIEYFRTFSKGELFSKYLRHPVDSGEPVDNDEWLMSERWKLLWLQKIHILTARYGDEPAIMAWELWNEMNAYHASEWNIILEWTQSMLVEIKKLSPRNLVVNSLGSFDCAEAEKPYEDFRKMKEMDFQQVHRYLDPGAPYEICHEDPVAFSIDVISRTRSPDKPIILAETGAVNDCHTGPFPFYRSDNRGILFQDTVYPAFFAGAAGPGHIWHWDSYVDAKNLWSGFKPMSDIIKGINLIDEDLKSVDKSNDLAWCLMLKGKHHILIWVRNKADNWMNVLRDQKESQPVKDFFVSLDEIEENWEVAGVYSIWQEDECTPEKVKGGILLPTFRYGVMIKVHIDSFK